MKDHEDNKQSEPKDEQRPPQIEEEPQGVWLVIRYDLADAGIRPIPFGEVYWMPPDIWITGGDSLGNAISGKPTPVHARICNLGNFPATPTRVDFKFAAPSLGIPWTAPQLIGTAWTTVPALGTVEVKCPKDWVPISPDGTTSACLLVTCSSVPFDPPHPTNPGHPVMDRHTGQRNVTIVQAPAGEPLEMEFQVGRTLAQEGELQIAALAAFGDPENAWLAADPLSRTLETETQEMPILQAKMLAKRSLALRKLDDQQASYEILKSAQIQEMLHIEDMKNLQAPFEGEGDAALPELTMLGEPMEIKPLETRPAKVTLVPPGDERSLVVHLYQLEDGVVTGGYTVIVNPQ